MSEQTTMWAVHVQGPDDLHACPDREVADALALVLNNQFKRHARPDGPLMVATVTEWPYGYEEWKAASEQLCFEPVPAEQPCGACGAVHEPGMNTMCDL